MILDNFKGVNFATYLYSYAIPHQILVFTFNILNSLLNYKLLLIFEKGDFIHLSIKPDYLFNLNRVYMKEYMIKNQA